MKVLAAAGDAGFLATNDDKVASEIRMLRNIGQRQKGVFETYGYNSRLDTIQAAICLVKLKYFNESLKRRKAIALRYNSELANCKNLILPPVDDIDHCDIYSAYALQAENRDNLKLNLENKGIEVMIHWDPPLHRQSRFGFDKLNLPATDAVSKKVISLPIDPEMTDEEQEYIIKSIKNA
jgi:dTDP-4-amino-4,6-dideoxygalactose transaminase